MKKLGLAQCKLNFCACAAIAALLAGCGGSGQGTQIVPASSFARRTVAQQAPLQSRRYLQIAETIIHSFAGAPNDGDTPEAGLLDIGGTLYGTTAAGGDVDAGTVFKVRSFTESVVYSFAGPDGALPDSSLVDANGALRGTTAIGGSHDKGTVFEIAPSGGESVLHSFGEKSDGAKPFAGLTKDLRKLYGTTRAGGAVDYGTVYEINESGDEKVIHSFGSGDDGAVPLERLTDSNGVLYGVTEDGPILGSSLGNGTVFRITPSGVETVLYRFAGAPDGAHPFARLLAVGDVLYGTTREGGKSNRGSVFKITASGMETVLHSFAADPDGAHPDGALIDINGTLYGTTCEGGTHRSGTFYSITKSGTETVLYNFKGDSSSSNPDGDCPGGDLIEKDGSIYGTTSQGGLYGAGTVFSISL
jgi:uncharacterized repeat protein (TIGR03803 family)